MSSGEGFEILKKWQIEATSLMLYSRRLGGRERLFEVSVHVTSFDGSSVILSLDESDEIEKLSLEGAAFEALSFPGGTVALEIKFPDGELTVLREKSEDSTH